MDVFILLFLVLAWHVSDAPNTMVCDAGTYQSEDGNSCLPCPDGTYMPHKNHTSKYCISCTKLKDSALETLIKSCDNISDADIQCVDGYYRHRAEDINDIAYCKKCLPACPENYTQVNPCQNFTDRGCCPGENYDISEGEHGIRVCRKRPWICRRGQYLDTKQNDCKPCPHGTFMHVDYHSYNRCWDCQNKSETDLPLHAVITEQCNSTQPSQYVCKEGYHVNHSMSSRGDIGCSPCQTCDEGKFIGSQCDMHHDTVCCDKPNMTVEDGPHGKRCVDKNDKEENSDQSDACACSRPILPWVLFGLASVLTLVMCIELRLGCVQAWWQKHVGRTQHQNAVDSESVELIIEEDESLDDVKRKLDKVTKERDEFKEQIAELIAAHQKEKPNEKPEHSVGQNQTVPNIIRPRTSEQQNETSQRTQENAVVRELRMCLKSLKRNEVEAQASTAKRLGEMARDERVRQTILEFSDLMQELESLQESKHSRVRKNVTQALQVIKGTTSTTYEDGHPPAQTDVVPNTNAATAVQGNKPATDEDGRLPASFDSVSNTDDDITVHGATPTTSGKNCLTAALDIELNSPTDISVHEATPVTDDTRLPASSVNEQQTDHTDQGRGDVGKKLE